MSARLSMNTTWTPRLRACSSTGTRAAVSAGAIAMPTTPWRSGPRPWRSARRRPSRLRPGPRRPRRCRAPRPCPARLGDRGPERIGRSGIRHDHRDLGVREGRPGERHGKAGCGKETLQRVSSHVSLLGLCELRRLPVYGSRRRSSRAGKPVLVMDRGPRDGGARHEHPRRPRSFQSASAARRR